MKTIKISLFCGAIYFLLMAIAHAIGFKIPGLFIYFNVPSYAYQDRIISFLAFSWSVFYFMAFKEPNKQFLKSILIVGAVAIAMLTFINLNTDFVSFSGKINPSIFHIQTGLLLIYWIWLIFCYNKLKKL
ncbi:hypothetical protein DRQ25_11960 [Candidatus Fermentibacteria bacterium]|nr:MAG: hypothetical protein DRQ25_11960 [Candidatus Fermentibacteria bacterium]